MRNFFKKYLWVFEFIGVAILLAVGIVVNVLDFIFLYIVGLVLIVFGLLRVIPLVKTTKDNLMKVIFAVEVVLNVIAGVLLMVEGTKNEGANTDLMRYLVGAVLYVRGSLYFYATSIRRESTDYVKFFTHLGFITLGPIIVISNLFTTEVLGWIVLIMAVLSAIFIAISGVKNYKNYRYEQLAKDEVKRIKIKEEAKENGLEDPAPKKHDVIIPEEEEKEQIRL